MVGADCGLQIFKLCCSAMLCCLLCFCACVSTLIHAEGQDPLAVVADIMSRDLGPELDTMVLAAAAQKSAAM